MGASRHAPLIIITELIAERRFALKNISKKIEVLANLAIIFVAIALGSVLINRYLINSKPPSASLPAGAGNPTNSRIHLEGIDWAKTDKTLVMALSTTCRFCTESAPFYRKLSSSNPDMRKIAVLPQSVEEGRRYLKDLEVDVNEIVQAPMGSIEVSGTPTLLLVGRDGTVVSTWLGKLSAAEEDDVIRRMQSDMN